MTTSKLFKDCNFCAVKARQPGGWNLSYFETVEQAKSWISPADHYIVVNTETDTVVEHKNWDTKANKAIWDSPIELEIVKSERVKDIG